MALKAGYYGIKKSVLDMITGLAGSKIIKSIGNGLNLTDAGALSTDIDTDTMEYKNGKLAAKSISWDYSTDEVDTGRKWIDGRTIYSRVFSAGTTPWTIPGGETFATITTELQSVDTFISGILIAPSGGINPAVIYQSGGELYAQTTRNSVTTVTASYVIVEYVKIVVEAAPDVVTPTETTRSTKKLTKSTASADNK